VLAKKLRMKIMQEEHDAPMAGHYGERTTRMVVRKKFNLPEMK
jgi:hypothetical protein